MFKYLKRCIFQNTRYFNLLQNSEVSVSSDMSTGEGQGSRGQQKVTEGSSGQDLIEGMCSIPEFYDGTSVFMTGVTGFIGKSVLEKLLRACSGVDKIFVLIRSKRGVNPSDRIKELFESKLFEKVKKELGTEVCLEKVFPICGDMAEPNLGISSENEYLLSQSNISVVIHSAATIKFNEALRTALTVNTLGTLKVIRLSRKFPNLKTLVHVSTAYSNCDLSYIREYVYQSQFNPHKVIEAVDWVPDKALELMTPVLMGNKPNTYTFTKQLAENLLVEENKMRELPYVIVRPTIVGATWKEPFKGWIDNYSGASGLFVACGMGLLRTMMANPDAIANLVPVDIVSDVIIAAPWFRAMRILESSASKTSPRKTADDSSYPSDPNYATETTTDKTTADENFVINCESGHIDKPLVWDRVPRLIEKYYCAHPYAKAVRYPRMRVTDNQLKNRIQTALCHNSVAVLLDLLLRCTGQKPKVCAMYVKLHRSLESLEFFTSHYWTWEVKNLHDLDLMLEKFRRSRGDVSKQNWAHQWNISMQGLDWEKYVELYCIGTKKFVMKDDMSKMQQARSRMQKLKLINYLLGSFAGLVAAKLTHLIVKLFIRVARYIQSSDIGAALKRVEKMIQYSKSKIL
ncbi:fatty acyl-CoA reductase 1-like isoform X2 [Symsagittifera roscoffensis]|uniref:fatty acyl-CoA reductase 1-like isoform X2 n=1 Tax=Symsagittifera roscoffensis TaxID=84072 RepID=UPI00307BDFE7